MMETALIVLVVASPLVLAPAFLAWISASGRLSRWMWKRSTQRGQEYAGKPYVLSERDWGRVWEVELPPPVKKRITRAIYRGEVIEEPSQAAIAAEGARRAAHSLRRALPLWDGNAVAQVALGLVSFLVQDLALGLSFLALGAVTSGVAVLGHVLLTRARIAERLNAEVAHRAGIPPDGQQSPILLY